MYYRDADDAVYARDGYDYDGYKLRVEFPRGGGGSFRGGRGDRGGGGYRGDRRPGPPARRSQYRVLVTGIYYISWYIRGISLAFYPFAFFSRYQCRHLIYPQDYPRRVAGKT